MKKELKDNNLYFNDILVYSGTDYSVDVRFMNSCLRNKSDLETINKLIDKNNLKINNLLDNITQLKKNLATLGFSKEKIKEFDELDIIGF
jgi:hypothetical protein|nr:MAG TPA: hypothetical protein [Caudoviricetes sp.]DAN26921.1 MAG TPA: hypothetical protein [Caudoviricetes sp.]